MDDSLDARLDPVRSEDSLECHARPSRKRLTRSIPLRVTAEGSVSVPSVIAAVGVERIYDMVVEYLEERKASEGYGTGYRP